MEVQNMTDIQVAMKINNTKLQMLKLPRDECHWFLQRNKIKKLKTHFKNISEKLGSPEHHEMQSSTAYVREEWK